MKTILNVLLGLVVFAFGAYFLRLEMATPPTHTGHIYLFSGIAVLGVLLIRPDPIFSVVQRVFVILGDTNLPLVGGRRKGDPPAPPSGPPGGAP